MTWDMVHLTASTFLGGPERQMLGLARALGDDARTQFLVFAEGGRCRAFLEEIGRHGFDGSALDHDMPHLVAAARELAGRLAEVRPDALVSHGYKAAILGRIAARSVGVPAIAVSRGWTCESTKIRLYEVVDRLNLRFMDRVVCVSESQAEKVRRAGVPARKVVVIPNAIDASRFDAPDPTARPELERLFAAPVRRIVGAAGRLSPEKGFRDLVEAAARVAASDPEVGFVLFGEGVLRPALEAQVARRGLAGRFVLAGFRPDLDRLVPALDLLVQSSHTEGMPNVILEACAAGVPVVATAVGGTPEILGDALASQLVPARDPLRLAGRIGDTLGDEEHLRALGVLGRQRVRKRFTFEAQADRYRDLLAACVAERDARPAPEPRRGHRGVYPEASGAVPVPDTAKKPGR